MNDENSAGAGIRSRVATGRDAMRRATFFVVDDHVGAAIFTGALWFMLLGWQVDFVVNDNIAIANAFAAITEGTLSIERIAYTTFNVPTIGREGPIVPGMHVVDGRLYAENYGQLFLALPVLLVVWGVAAVTDLAVAIAGVWSLLLLAFAVNLGTVLERRRTATPVGGVVALALFGANLSMAVDVSEYWVRYMAVQLGSMLAAALAAVVLYRLVSRIHGRTVGGFAGAVAILGTPLGYWGTVPMRHATTALLVLLSVYFFYRSHEATGTESLRFRALAYVPVGVTAWVFAPEGLILLLALLVADLPGALSASRRENAVVAGALAGSLLPFFATNMLIAGNPLEPPVLLEPYTGAESVGLGSDAPFGGSSGTGGNGTAVNGSGASGGGGGGSGGSLLGAVVAAVVAIPARVGLFASMLGEALVVVFLRPERLYHTFVRSGYITQGPVDSSMNLTLLESMPLAGAAVAMVSVAGVRLRNDGVARLRRWASTPAGRTDLFVAAFVGLLTLSYVPTLPRQVQFTVRYLLPAMPLLVYTAFRFEAFRRPFRRETRTLLWSYLGAVLVGGQLLLAWVVTSGLNPPEAMQLHALIGLSAAGVVVAWSLLASATDIDDRVGAACIGLAAATTTVLVVLMTINYLASYGDLLLPVVKLVSKSIQVG